VYVPALPGPTETAANELTGMHREWYDYFYRRAGEGFGAVAGGRPSTRKRVLSLVKQQSPQAWRAIMNSAAEAGET
jgi:hypothetical protein